MNCETRRIKEMSNSNFSIRLNVNTRTQKNRIRSEIVNHRTKRLRFQHRDLMIRSTLSSTITTDLGIPESRHHWITQIHRRLDRTSTKTKLKKKLTRFGFGDSDVDENDNETKRCSDLLFWSWPASDFFYNTGSSSHALCIISAYELATPQPVFFPT